jgi:hypothetical protein
MIDLSLKGDSHDSVTCSDTYCGVDYGAGGDHLVGISQQL